MKVWKRKTVQSLVMFFIFLGSTSLAFSSGIKVLKQDKISPKFDSIIFGRIRVLSDVPRFYPSATECKLILWDIGDRRNPKKLDDFVIFAKGNLKKDEKNVYDIPFYAETNAGEYLFGYGGYDFSQLTLSDFVKTTQSSNIYLNGLYGKVFKSCTIPSGGLVYLGVIQIIFTDISYNPDNNRINTETSVTIEDDYDADLARFQNKYPKIYEQLKDKIEKAEWEDFED